jgi:hypothetical protein
VCTQQQQEQCGGIQTKWLAGTAVREARPRCDPQASSTSHARTHRHRHPGESAPFRSRFTASQRALLIHTCVGCKLIWVRWMRHNLIFDEGVLMYLTFLLGSCCCAITLFAPRRSQTFELCVVTKRVDQLMYSALVPPLSTMLLRNHHAIYGRWQNFLK